VRIKNVRPRETSVPGRRVGDKGDAERAAARQRYGLGRRERRLTAQKEDCLERGRARWRPLVWTLDGGWTCEDRYAGERRSITPVPLGEAEFRGWRVAVRLKLQLGTRLFMVTNPVWPWPQPNLATQSQCSPEADEERKSR